MGDFGETLKKWEELRRDSGEKTHPMEDALELYPPTKEAAKDKSAAGGEKNGPIAGRRLPVREVVDLHGLTAEQAIAVCEAAIRRNTLPGERRRLLIIHGKGIHSARAGKLLEVVRRFLKKHPLVGETGIPPAKEGGDGAVWAICRQRSR